MILFLSDMIIPVIFVVVVMYGIFKKVSIFDTFVSGVGDGLRTVADVFPTMLGLLVAVGILRASGALDLLTLVLAPLTNQTDFPAEVLPLTLMRIVSASAARGLLLDLLETYGADSFTGRLSSIIMSSTETIFYTMSVYFFAVKVTKTRYTLAGALIANLAGVIAAFFVASWVFGV